MRGVFEGKGAWDLMIEVSNGIFPEVDDEAVRSTTGLGLLWIGRTPGASTAWSLGWFWVLSAAGLTRASEKGVLVGWNQDRLSSYECPGTGSFKGPVLLRRGRRRRRYCWLFLNLLDSCCLFAYKICIWWLKTHRKVVPFYDLIFIGDIRGTSNSDSFALEGLK